MPLSRAEAARVAIESRWAGTTPEQRRAGTHKARVASAVKCVAECWHELTDDQRAAIFQAMARGGITVGSGEAA
jgi:hypothetical protein